MESSILLMSLKLVVVSLVPGGVVQLSHVCLARPFAPAWWHMTTSIVVIMMMRCLMMIISVVAEAMAARSAADSLCQAY